MLKHIPAIAIASALLASTAFAQSNTTTTPAPADTPAATSPSTTAPADPPAATSPSTAPSSSTDATPSKSSSSSTAAAAPMMTDEEAKAWINKTVYSSDGRNLGEVSQVLRDNSGHVTELHADIGGFLGIGETRVRVMPNEFKLASDRVILNVASDQAKNLPQIEK